MTADETNEMHEPVIPRHLVEANARAASAVPEEAPMSDTRKLAEAVMALAQALTIDPSLNSIDYARLVEPKLRDILEEEPR